MLRLNLQHRSLGNPRRSRSLWHRTLACEPLEERRMLSGVTLITHGFNSNVNGWVTQMANAIQARPDLELDQPRYLFEVVEQTDGQLNVNVSLSGPDPEDVDTSNPEIVILLDWSDVAGTISPGGGKTRSTSDVAAVVAQSLVNPVTESQLTLAELPLHLMGHSRGASLVAELARELGERGVWVDQVSTWDPHPVDGVNEPFLFNYDFGDPAMASWENVVFWDNYWRTEGARSFDFTGEPVADVHNRQLSESVLSSGGYSYEHSDVHLWYYGTVDTIPPVNNGDHDVPAGWYGGAHPQREESGFHFSRMVGGNRPSDGMLIDFDENGVARNELDWSQATWPNIVELSINGPTTVFEITETIDTAFYYQDPDNPATITFAFDKDRNPFNGIGLEADPTDVESTGADLARVDSFGVPTDAADGAAGVYYLVARINDGSHVRFAYVADPVTLVEGGGAHNPLDVNRDGSISPIDALLVINWLLERGSGQTPFEDLDVNDDAHVSPIDALLVINYLNRPEPEGETLVPTAPRDVQAIRHDIFFTTLESDDEDEELLSIGLLARLRAHRTR